MAKKRRIDIRGILADADLRRELMVPTLQATQAREGIETTREQAERAYYVVTEAERVACFDLTLFRGGKGLPERREEKFVQTLGGRNDRVRFDVARRDFASLEGAPLAYDRVVIVARLFRDFPTVGSMSRVAQGVIVRPDEPFMRRFWEIAPRRELKPWVPLHKGGGFCRFFFEPDLVIDWSDSARHAFHRLRDESLYFRRGLTWPRAGGFFSLRYMREGCVFSDKGPAILPERDSDIWYLAGILNSPLADFVMRGLVSRKEMGARWEKHVIEGLPVAQGSADQQTLIRNYSETIYETKALWDQGNETSPSFVEPWVLRVKTAALPSRLERVAHHEEEQEAHIRQRYIDLNDAVYQVYGISDSMKGTIETMLGRRPPEVLWPQMEGKTAEQKRMEHIFRLLSYVVKRVVEADEDGIVPFVSVAGEPSLLDRVTQELQQLFANQEAGQVETEIANELKKSVKGYRRSSSIAEWVENVFFEYHCDLYKSRPILWHIASAQGTQRFAFGALVHYHRFDRNRIAKLRGQYLRDAVESFRREAGLAEKGGNAEQRQMWQERLEEARELDRQLQGIQEGHHEGPDSGERDFRIRTPWKPAAELPQGWDPDIDDGVKVNIEPFQKAGVLRVAKVI